MRPLPAGAALGPYVLEGEVGRGGMGAVYRARRLADDAVVALKVLNAGITATSDQRERFRREAELTARLNHPAIVRVHDAGAAGPLSYIAMDLVEGEPLSARIGRLAPLEAARLVAQVARALEYAHAQGILHRDLKPANVLVRRDDGRAVVLDFGVSRAVESATLTRTGALLGTPSYLSPEQAAGGKATARSDVHALGVVLFEAITGAPPFQRDDLQGLLVAIASEPPARPGALRPGVPHALDRACLRALAKRPDQRPDAGELAAELEAIVEGRGVEPGRPSLAVVLVGALALAGAGGAVAYLARPGTPAPPQASGSSTTDVAAVASPVADRARPDGAATPPAPSATEPWTEPEWLRVLEAGAGDLDALVAAHDAFERSPRADDASRARAVPLLAKLDAEWRPRGKGGDEDLDGLVWLHWLWLRVDPGHQPSPSRQRRLTGWNVYEFGAGRDARYRSRVGEGLIALTPTERVGYMMYANNLDTLPMAERKGELLERGFAIVKGSDDPAPWAAISVQYLAWLDHVERAGDPARAAAARAAIGELGRDARLKKGDFVIRSAACDVLLRAADAVAPNEAQDFLARVEELDGPSVRLFLARARRLTRVEPPSFSAAAREAERAQALLESQGAGADVSEVARCAVLTSDLWWRANAPASAYDALRRGMTISGTRDPQAGLALRRALLVLEQRESGDNAFKALFDVASRLERRGELLRQRGLPTVDVDAAAADVARALSDSERAAEHLRRWTDPEAARRLDP